MNSSTSTDASSAQLKDSRAAFVRLMIEQDVLQFGEFSLKSGRQSPYFFNLGKVADAKGLAALGESYAQALATADWDYDVLFGPAYKGIPIAAAAGVAIASGASGSGGGNNPGIAYNRKEAKDHGEGGQLVGADISGQQVVVIDDVLTAGTAVREALGLIKAAGGKLKGVLVALDREERVQDGSDNPADGSGVTAIGALSQELNVPVRSIVRLQDVIDYLDSEGTHLDALHAILNYRNTYCVY